jgi:hypothetical protein
MTEPRLSDALLSQTETEKIARSESLSALFSYFRNWSKTDPSLRFGTESVLTIDTEIENGEEAA